MINLRHIQDLQFRILDLNADIAIYIDSDPKYANELADEQDALRYELLALQNEAEHDEQPRAKHDARIRVVDRREQYYAKRKQMRGAV